MKDATHISVLLDRSGSMEAVKDETISGFNHFLKEQKAVGANAWFTLAQFDSESTDVVHEARPVRDVPNLNGDTYQPRGSTPLLDALGQTIERFIHPRTLSQLWLLAFAGVIGFIGNEIAAQLRLRAGARLASAALVADGRHARVDGFVSLGVIASAAVVALGFKIADPIVGLIITLVILRITWQSWQTIRGAQIEIDHFEHRRL